MWQEGYVFLSKLSIWGHAKVTPSSDVYFQSTQSLIQSVS